ncbi:MAG: hypothetical protein N2C14_31250, partial [Planctomycetales bacterium]
RTSHKRRLHQGDAVIDDPDEDDFQFSLKSLFLLTMGIAFALGMRSWLPEPFGLPTAISTATVFGLLFLTRGEMIQGVGYGALVMTTLTAPVMILSFFNTSIEIDWAESAALLCLLIAVGGLTGGGIHAILLGRPLLAFTALTFNLFLCCGSLGPG